MSFLLMSFFLLFFVCVAHFFFFSFSTSTPPPPMTKTTTPTTTSSNLALGLPDKLFVAFDSVLLTGLGRVALMPVLVLAARLCPEGVEATLYAALMSLSNAGGGVGEATGAALTAWLGVTATDFGRLPLLVSICAGASALPLLLLPLVSGGGGGGGGAGGGGGSGGGSERRKTSESGVGNEEGDDEASELVPLKKTNGDSVV